MNNIQIYRELVTFFPQLQGLVKEAELSAVVDGFPVTSRETALVSAHKVAYLEKIAKVKIPDAQAMLVKQASTLYGFADEVETALVNLSTTLLEKEASERNRDFYIQASMSNLKSMEEAGKISELVKVAHTLTNEYPEFEDIVNSDIVKRYTVSNGLNSGAVRTALEKRAFATHDSDYLDILKVLENHDVSSLEKSAQEKVLSAIQTVDDKHRLNWYGWNIYKEATVKVAEQKFKLGKKEASLQQILDVVPALQDGLGKETVKEIMDAGPEAGPIIASLPMDLKLLIGTYL